MSRGPRGINSHHFSLADPKPKINANRLTFYNMRYCSYAHRAVLVAFAKNIE